MFVNATRVTERTFEAVQRAKNAACRLARQNMMRIVAAITAGKEGHTVDLAVALIRQRDLFMTHPVCKT